jgi:hypothetical protein
LSQIGNFLQIVKAVIIHEAVLKAQAKKMNVESLRSKAPGGEAIEIKITKVKITKHFYSVCKIICDSVDLPKR